MTPDEEILSYVSDNPGSKAADVHAKTQLGRSTTYRRIGELLRVRKLLRDPGSGLRVASAVKNASEQPEPLCAALMTACYALLASDVSDERKASVLGDAHFKAGLPLRGD